MPTGRRRGIPNESLGMTIWRGKDPLILASQSRALQILLEQVVIAHMTMRQLSGDEVRTYLDTAGEAVTASVGAYQLEGLGVHLFERIEGDHFTILGLPLLPLLAFLRGQGLLGV